MSDYEKLRLQVNGSLGKQWHSLLNNQWVDPTPAPPASGMFFGAAQADYDAWNSTLSNPTGTKLGGKNSGMNLRRSFDNGWKNNFANTTASGDPTRGAASLLSFDATTSIASVNSGSVDSVITSFFNSIPTGHYCFVSWIHECDQGGKITGQEAAYRTACDRIYDLLVASNADQNFVRFGVIVTAGVFRASTQNTYFSSNNKFDFVGIDAYEYWRPSSAPPDPKAGHPPHRTLEYLIGGNPPSATYPSGGTPAVAWADARGKRVLIPEFGQHPDPADLTSRPNRLKAAVAYAQQSSMYGMCYFHSGGGESGPWWGDCFPNWTDPQNRSVADPDSVIAFRDILASLQGNV